MPPKIAATFSAVKLARRDQALRRARFVVALHQFEHAPAKEAALGVDFVDRQRQPAGDRLAGLGGCARQSRDLPDLDRIGGESRRSSEQRNRSAGNHRARRAPILPQQVLRSSAFSFEFSRLLTSAKAPKTIMAKEALACQFWPPRAFFNYRAASIIVGALLGDHDHRRIGVAADDRRHDRGVDDAQAIDTAHAQAGRRPPPSDRYPSCRCRPGDTRSPRWRG